MQRIGPWTSSSLNTSSTGRDASTSRSRQDRAKFFVTIVSAAIAVLAFLYDSATSVQVYYWCSAGVLLLLTGMGMITYARLVEGHIGITTHARGLNRIRRFFCEAAPDIAPYVTLPTHDDVPRFGAVGFLGAGVTPSSLSTMVTSIDTALMGCAAGLVGMGAIGVSTVTGLGLIGSFCLASVLLHVRYYRQQVRRAERVTNVAFPRSTPRLEVVETIAREPVGVGTGRQGDKG